MKHFDRSWTRIGSPPHGRGKVGAILNAGLADRITPAWAGKRAQERFFVFCHEDHPRVGGEKGPRPGQVGPLPGSPPHGRGKAALADAVQYVVGITPAWAGKSYRFPVGLPPTWDHPRVGGEKCYIGESKSNDTGSPPRGRGKV